jgi:hypothetical protein
MATWWEITFTGEPTESDFARVAEMVAQGFTSGQLINGPGDEDEEGPAAGCYAPGRPGRPYLPVGNGRRGVRGHPFKGDGIRCGECGCTRRVPQHDGPPTGWLAQDIRA